MDNVDKLTDAACGVVNGTVDVVVTVVGLLVTVIGLLAIGAVGVVIAIVVGAIKSVV